MNPGANRGEFCLPRIPPKYIVIGVFFSSARLDDGDAGKQAPVEGIAVCRSDEVRSEMADRRAHANQERMQTVGTLIDSSKVYVLENAGSENQTALQLQHNQLK